MGEFGDKFRKAREQKELTFDNVSNVTKINARMLQAIEEEHFDELPGGVFNKGFIRAYAKHLGLDPEEAVTEYLACLRQAQIDAHEVWEPERPLQPQSSQLRPLAPARSVESSTPVAKSPVANSTLVKSTIEKLPAALRSQSPVQVEELPDLQLPRAEHVRPARGDFAASSSSGIPWRIIALVAVVIVLAGILWTRRSHSTNSAASVVKQPATMAAPASAAAAAAPSSAPASVNQNQNQNQNQNPAPAGTLAHAATSNLQPPRAQSAPATASSTAPPASASPQPEDNTTANDVTVRNFQKSVRTPTEKAAVPLKLVIRATETSWISVLADGQTVSQETLIAPAHNSVRANHEIVVRIGNAAGVTFLWNGHEIPADGGEAEAKTFVFDATGMRVVPSTPPAN